MAYTFYFEKLDVWNLSKSLVKYVYQATEAFPSSEKYGLTSQLKRASISVSSNIAEGSGRKSYKDQAHFSQVAYSSLMEVLNQLLLSVDLNYLPKEQEKHFRPLIEELANKLNALRDTQLSRVSEPETEYVHAPTAPQILKSSIPQFLKSSNPQILNSSIPQIFQHPTAIIDDGAQIGNGSKIWHFSHVMGGAILGENCNLGQNVYLAKGVILGNNVKVQNNVSIYEGVTCEDDVFLGPSMVFTNVMNPRSAVNRKTEYMKTVVGKGATIGANATIVCGNNIGAFAFIGAGAVVTKEVPPYALIVGNPGRQIGWVSEHGERLTFEEGKAQCPGSRVWYELTAGKARKIG